MTVSELCQAITAAADAHSSDVKDEERMQLLTACQKLERALETTYEAHVRIIFGAHEAMALRLAIDMKLFDAAAATSTDGAEVRTEQLASRTGVEPVLVIRIMRILAGMGLFREVGPDTFQSTAHADAYVTDSPFTAGAMHITQNIEILSRLPGFFEQNGFKNPSDAYNGPFQFAMGTKLHYFDWLRSQPKLQRAFNTVMGISRLNRGEEWFEFYPVKERLVVKSSLDPLLVDVGGGLGHDLIAFKEKYPNLPGRLIVQDLPIVIDDIKDLPPGIEAMAHDFFKPQPVKGAKIYYFRTVLHDWPDRQAREILRNIWVSMNRDSILLVNENAISESKVPLYAAELDLSMMALFSSLDRTETQFKELLESSGFELVHVWTSRTLPALGTLFEAVVKT